MPLQCSSCGVEFEAPTSNGGASTSLCSDCGKTADITRLFKLAQRGAPKTPLPPDQDTAPEVLAAAANPANRIGRYVRVRLIAKGGQAEVWKAWDLDLGRWVAVKFPRLDGPIDIERMRREACAAGMISHPSVAAVYEFGQSEGRPYIAMQYIDGTTLAAYPKEDKRKLVAFVRDAALGIASAHAQGVVHRDLTPSNLMVDGEGRHVYVMDFGIARVVTSMRTSTSVAGTPAYMSPEQARGERADERSDVYSLGATLYDLLSGKPPFEGMTAVDVLDKVEREPAKPIPGLDADLNTIVLKCLEKPPDQRYSTAMELGEELARWLNGEPIRSRPPTPLDRARRIFAKHRRMILGAAATLFAALVLIGCMVIRREHRLQKERHARHVGGRVVALSNSMKLARPYWYVPDLDPREAIQGVDGALAQLDRFMDEPENANEAEGWAVLGEGWWFVGDLAKAEDRLNRALALQSDHAAANATMARICLERGDPAAARGFFAKAGSPDVERLNGHLAAAWRAYANGDEAAALQFCDAGAAKFRNAPGTEDYWVLRGLLLGNSAIPSFQKAVERRPNYPWAWRLLGAAREKNGERAAARVAYRICIEMLPEKCEHRLKSEEALTKLK